MKIAVFAYNFPHRKTQEFLFRLYVDGYDVRMVLGANQVKLNTAKASLRVKPCFSALVEPRKVCERFGWRYEVVAHNTGQCAELIKSAGVDIGVVAGARILKEPVLSAPRAGIINFHPGLIPEVRGMDALQWAILQDKPIGVTAHLIDRRVDAGLIILKEEIVLRRDDTLIDVSLKIQETEINMLPKALDAIAAAPDLVGFESVGQGEYNKKMGPEFEARVPERFRQRLRAL
ncbi:formyltransferase family protein [bacterium]|nr:formyltransferase family protein [bacterium]